VRIQLHPAARAELRAAALWYDELSEGAGSELIDELYAALDRVAALPTASVRWPGLPDRDPPIFRGKTHRFPYAFAFELRSDVIYVLAVTHQRRRPLYWYSRVT
jgi:plasmid stabilization system protein ParE